ncbi:hypothetical protein QYR00_23155 (plasmid) [Agrobacterium tumefaciens]|nr:hypothetical protein QYR00_23155 [Agrobacterium tumefaciens]
MDTSDTPRQEVPASTLPQIQVTVQGITNQYGAECLGQQMFHILREVGEYIDISALDGVTVAVDYDEALRDLDRGVEGLAPLSRTNDEGLAGVGKSIVVMRGDAVKTHIVLSAGPVCPIVLEEADRDEEDFRTAIAIIAHECAHVEENAFREDQFPGIHFRPPTGHFIRDHEQHFAEACWGEYAVCRLSAGFAVNEEARFRDNLAVRLKDCRGRARDGIRSYRLHGDVVRVFQEVGIVILEPLRIASYLFGHLDGMNESDNLCEVAPELPTEDQAFVRAIGRLVEQLRGLWDTRGDWPSYDALIDVGAVGFRLFEEFGVHAQPQPDGQAYINVPFTVDTMPAGSAQAYMLRALMGGYRS